MLGISVPYLYSLHVREQITVPLRQKHNVYRLQLQIWIARCERIRLVVLCFIVAWHFFLFDSLWQTIAVTFRRISHRREDRDAVAMTERVLDWRRGLRWRQQCQENEMMSQRENDFVSLPPNHKHSGTFCSWHFGFRHLIHLLSACHLSAAVGFGWFTSNEREKSLKGSDRCARVDKTDASCWGCNKCFCGR